MAAPSTGTKLGIAAGLAALLGGLALSSTKKSKPLAGPAFGSAPKKSCNCGR